MGGSGGKGGSDPSDAGTAITPYMVNAQQALKNLPWAQAQAALGGQQLYPTVDAQSQGYTSQGYNSQGYNAPQMPYSSPMDYLQRGEMDTARNVMENFYGSGGGGSGRGGGSGAGFDREAALSSQLGQGAMGRYMNALQPYSQMQAQASQFGAGSQNVASQFGAQAQNQASQFGAQAQNTAGMFNAAAQNQSYAAPWDYQGLYANTTGSEMVDPGSQGKGMGETLGTAALFSSFMSDIRLKKNIRKIGSHKGMDVIEFEYLWGGGRKVGLIAQQVRDVIPHAVGVQNGYLYVNYALV